MSKTDNFIFVSELQRAFPSMSAKQLLRERKGTGEPIAVPCNRVVVILKVLLSRGEEHISLV